MPDFWTTSAPEAQGVSSEGLLALLDFAAANEADSVLLVRHGVIVLDASYAPYRAERLHAVHSATKTVMALLIGIARRRGELAALDRPLLETFAGEPIENVDERKRRLTPQHLLDMSSGLAWTEPLAGVPLSTLEMERSPDWARFVLDRPMVSAPGERFDYNSGNSQLLSALLTRAVGLSALDYARAHLFGPLGICDVVWEADPRGVSVAGYGLQLKPRDMAKLGLLMLQRGEWDGQRLLDASFFEHIEDAQLPMNLPAPMNYANGCWCRPDRSAYMAVGTGRQVIMVLPKLDAVLVLTGRKNYPFSPLLEVVTKAIDDEAGEPTAGERLRARCAELADPAPGAHTSSPLAREISGRSYQFERNPTGLRTLCLRLEGDAPQHSSTVHGPRGAISITGPLGLDGSFASLEEPWVAARGSWADDHSFVLETRHVTEGFRVTLTLRFEGEQVSGRCEISHGWSAELQGKRID